MNKKISTLNMSHEEWLLQRKLGIGGSDAGAIAGLNPYVSPMQVYLDKTSDEINETDSEAMRQGRDLEEYVAQRFMEATDKKVRRVNQILYSEKYPFMYANVDRMVVTKDGTKEGLECKTASPYSADKWEDGKAPAHYIIQCLHYMAVTGADAWNLAVVIFGREFKYIRIERDEEMIRNLISIEEDFWLNHVQKRVMPSPDGSEASEELIKQYFRKADVEKKILLNGFDQKLERRTEIDELLKRLEKEKKQIEQEVKVYMEDAQEAESNEFQVSWKNYVSERLDTKLLKAEKPDVYNQYLKSQESRRFTVKSIAVA